MDKIDRLDRVIEKRKDLADQIRILVLNYQHQLADAMNWTRELMEKAEETDSPPRARKKQDYDFTNDIVAIVKDAEEPVPVQQILELLIPIAQQAGEYSAEAARGNILRSIGQLCTRFYKAYVQKKQKLGTFPGPGVICVEIHKGGYNIVPYKIKPKNTKVYPLNLIWHIDRYLEKEK
jgi:hypothetical protein